MKVREVYLVRHAETDWNAQGRWQGNLQTELSETGTRQAQALARYLRDHNIEEIYSSDLIRSSRTAGAIAEQSGVKVIEDHRLQESNLGILQGLTRDEITEKYPHILQAEQADPFHYVIPEGESRFQVQKRMVDAWLDITKNAGAETIAIVSHGRAIRLLLLKLFAAENTRIAKVHFYNTSITCLYTENSAWHIRDLAITPHLNGFAE